MGVVNVVDEEKQESCTSDESIKDEHVGLPKPLSQQAQLHVDDEDVFSTSLIGRCGVVQLLGVVSL